MTVTIDNNVEIPMRDNTLLRADIYRTEKVGPQPVILFRTPYNKNLINSDALTPRQTVLGGYACVVQDTRGRFASDGGWGGIAWHQEGPDTYDTVEWIAEQPWCDGNVGMAGPSYLGIVQWLGAMEQPPHLKAIAPTMSTSVEFERFETGGAFRLDHILSWLAFMAADWLQRSIAAGDPPDATTIEKISKMAANPRVAMDALPLRENPWFDLEGFPISISQLLDGTLNYTPTFDYSRIQIPTLSVGGFFDIFPRATIKQFNVVVNQGAASIADEHRLIMGPWFHAGILPPYQGEMHFGLLAGATYSKLPQKHLQFFDRHLKGKGDPLPRIEYFLAGRNQWLTTETWPPKTANTKSLYLRSNGEAATRGGTLAASPPTENEPADHYRSDPMNPVPTHGGRVLYLGGLAPGPLSQAHLETRNDVLVYTGDTLSTELVVTGNVSLVLFAATSAPDCDWIVKLLDVYPDGRAIFVADGLIRARYREGLDNAQPVIAGEALEYHIDLGPVAWAFQAEHKIRLHIQSSNFPHIDSNMQTGNPVGSDAEGMIASQAVIHTRIANSKLILPTT